MKKRTGILLLLMLSLCGCGESGLQVHTMSPDTTDVSAEAEAGTAERTDSTAVEKIVVYVCGAVAREGVYELPCGSRGADALAAAGGYSDDAAAGAVNLARILEDGEQLRFPTAEEADTLLQAEPAEGQQENGRVNINTADIARLTVLPGIGEGRAADIISYREKNGPFEKPEDLMKVPGIKEATWQKLKDRVSVR